jgi:hypothetical protein
LSSGVNHCLEYGDDLANSVCLSTTTIMALIRDLTVYSSWASDLMSGRGFIVVCIIFPIFSQSACPYAFRGFCLDFSSG